MKTSFLCLPALCVGLSFAADAPSKVGIIHIQTAILATKDGQKTFGDLQQRFTPKKSELDRKQSEIAALQDQLKKGSNTMAEDARTKLMRDIDQKTKAFNRDAEDAQAEFEQQQNKLMQEVGQKMMAVIDKYAKDNGYSLILDVSSPQNPVLYAGNNIDVTQEVVGLFDKNSPAASAPAAAKPSVGPAGPAPSAPRTAPAPAIRRPPGSVK